MELIGAGRIDLLHVANIVYHISKTTMAAVADIAIEAAQTLHSAPFIVYSRIFGARAPHASPSRLKTKTEIIARGYEVRRSRV
jgi:hypothetical protein